MFFRVKQLFLLFCRARLRQSLRGFPLFDTTGRLVGNVDQIRIAGHHLEVHGWSLAEKVTLVIGERFAEVVPQIERPDVRRTRDGEDEAAVGFALSLPLGPQPWLLVCSSGSLRHVFNLPGLGRLATRLAQLRILPAFFAMLLGATPQILRWALHRDDAARAALIARLNLGAGPQIIEINPGLFAPDQPHATATGQKITIVIPVFNALDVLKQALDRVLRHTDLPWRLVIVEDCSTDPEVRPYLRGWVEDATRDGAEIELVENAENLGFIRSVNRALARALEHGDHVVLLNSDALVPARWASRLLRPILTQDKVASVTPMSNDAEIFSVPMICKRSTLGEGQADRIDKVAALFNPNAELAPAPTGVGFCMAMSIGYLRRFPELDVSFGKGYGEEVDWCQRVRAAGGVHLGLPGLFVEHRGGTSFGSAEKLRLIAQNNDIILRRYPQYNAEVRDFILGDPMASARLALSVAWAAAGATGPLSVYLAHSLGGGAEKYLQNRILADIESVGAAIVLRVGGALRWQVEIYCAAGMNRGRTNDFGLLTQVLDPIARRRIVYSCAVGARDAATIPDHLLALRRPGDGLEVLLHDYFPLSPAYTLLDSDDRYLGVPDATDSDAAHRTRTGGGHKVSLAEWRERWGSLLKAADEIVVFSQDSRRLLCSAYPEVEASVRVRPHKPLAIFDAVERPSPTLPVIGILGNLAPQKGAGIVAEMSRYLATDGRARLVLIGNIDPAYKLGGRTRVHGNYEIAEIPDLVKRYEITDWFIPSIWPETFSYVTHEALATGLPVVGFDIGAQAEALHAAANGRTIPFELARGNVQSLVEALLDGRE